MMDGSVVLVATASTVGHSPPVLLEDNDNGLFLAFQVLGVDQAEEMGVVVQVSNDEVGWTDVQAVDGIGVEVGATGNQQSPVLSGAFVRFYLSAFSQSGDGSVRVRFDYQTGRW